MNKYPYYEFDLFNEKWKLLTSDYYDIIPNRYLISESGKIFSLLKHNIMKTFQSPDGNGSIYARIKLCTNQSKQCTVAIHRLVALYFLDKNDDPEHKTIVDHLDGDKLHNHYTNLEWISPIENMVRTFKSKSLKRKYSGRHFNTYTEDQIQSIRYLIKQGFSNLEIATMLYEGDKDDPDIREKQDFIQIYSFTKYLRKYGNKF